MILVGGPTESSLSTLGLEFFQPLRRDVHRQYYNNPFGYLSYSFENCKTFALICVFGCKTIHAAYYSWWTCVPTRRRLVPVPFISGNDPLPRSSPRFRLLVSTRPYYAQTIYLFKYNRAPTVGNFHFIIMAVDIIGYRRRYWPANVNVGYSFTTSGGFNGCFRHVTKIF